MDIKPNNVEFYVVYWFIVTIVNYVIVFVIRCVSKICSMRRLYHCIYELLKGVDPSLFLSENS